MMLAQQAASLKSAEAAAKIEGKQHSTSAAAQLLGGGGGVFGGGLFGTIGWVDMVGEGHARAANRDPPGSSGKVMNRLAAFAPSALLKFEQ